MVGLTFISVWIGLGLALDVNVDASLGIPPSDATAANSSRAEMFSNALLPDVDTSASSRRPSSLVAAFMMRSVSFNGFDTPRESFDDRFGDVCI